MKFRTNRRTTVFALTGLLLYGSMLSAKPLEKVGAEAILDRSKSLIELHFHDRAMIDVMAEVAGRSGVKIIVAPDLVDQKVDVSISRADWTNAIRSLLKAFDHIAIVDRDGRFRKIWITGRKGDATADAGVRGIAADGASPVDGGAERRRGIDPELDAPLEVPAAIWQPLETDAVSWQAEGAIPSAPVQSDPDFLADIRVGQPLEIAIPQEQSPLFAVVSETHSQLNGQIQVWSGPIDGSHETASFTITRGQITTYITVATGSSIYEISVDNVTGLGAVVNELDLTKGKTEKDFVVPEEAESSLEQGALVLDRPSPD